MVSAWKDKGWQYLAAGGLLFLAATTITSFITYTWVIMALPVGFLFGFFLLKGDLCGAAGCSEVLLFRSWEKLAGIWICIVTCMAGFAVLQCLGWVVLNPKPFAWLSLVAGGAIFGVGTVFAGGCVTGSLYKAGTGNLNSIVAVAGMPLGVGAVYSGFLQPLRDWMKQFVLLSDQGGAITFSSLTGLSFTGITVIMVCLTLAVAIKLRRGKEKKARDPWSVTRIMTRGWKPWKSGIAIGILAMPAYVCAAHSGHNYPLGTTGGVYYALRAAADRDAQIVCSAEGSAKRNGQSNRSAEVSAERDGQSDPSSKGPAGSDPQGSAETKGGAPVILWILLLDAGLVAGAWLAARLGGRARFLPKPKEQVMLAFLGGTLIGSGAALGEGCFYGHVVSGWALMSAAGLLFFAAMLLTNWATTYFYLMGGAATKGR